MADARIEQLADILVGHSIQVKQGEKVIISGTTEAIPLIREVYRRVLRVGAHPITQVEIPGLQRIFMDEANGDQLDEVGHTMLTFEHADAYIKIMAESNTRELTGVDPDKVKRRSLATRRTIDYIVKGGARWVLTRFPTNAMAQDAGLPLEAYERFIYSATNVDYAAMRESMLAAAERFDRAKKVRIVGRETDITIDIEGRKGVICAGENNVPDGEFFYTPNHLLTEGDIYFEWPTTFKSQEVAGIRLSFREGRVVAFSAEKGEQALRQAIETDEGASFLGELGIGANFGITEPSKDILFDEKIGGSVHLALGNAYPDEGGPGNVSAIHWDIVKNLKDGGEIYLDGELVQNDGKWTF